MDLLNKITNLPTRLYGHRLVSNRALEIAIEYAITVYDANFPALAEKSMGPYYLPQTCSLRRSLKS